MSDKKPYAKPKMQCPFCGQELAVPGMTQHVRFKHPEKVEDFNKNRERYIAEYTVKDDKPEPEEIPEPVEPEEPAKTDLEVEDAEAESFQEPEQFRIRQVKKGKGKPKPKTRTKPEPKPEIKRRYGFRRH